MALCAGILRAKEGRYELKSPTLFIFAEKDEVIPLDQVSVHSFYTLFKNPVLLSPPHHVMYIQYVEIHQL